MARSTPNTNTEDVHARELLTPQQAEADEVGLAASVAGLSQLVAGSLTLEELLTQVAQFAAHAIPGADGAGVTM